LPTRLNENRHKRNFLKTLDRGLRALEAFTPEQPALTLSELSRRLALDPGTAFRFAYTLEHLGYLRRDPASGAYRLSGRVLDLAQAVRPQADLRAAARPHMEALSREVEETVSLAVLDGTEIVVVEQVESPRPVTVRGRLGERQPAHCTAQGKMLLASLPEPELRARLQSLPLRAYGPRTITRLAALQAELRRTRQRGFALNNDEMAAGLRAVAVPVGRLSLADMQARYQPRLAQAAARIAAALEGAPAPAA